MKLIKGSRLVGYVLMISVVAMLAQSCSGSKKACGCGADINGIYKRPKRVF